MSLEIFVRREIRDKEGNLIKDSGLQKSKSFVLGFLDLVLLLMDELYNVPGPAENITDTTNNVRAVDATLGALVMFAVRAAANDDTYGIVVGSGITAESNADYKLASQIAHGVAGLNYGGVSVTAAAIIGANVDMLLTRSFTNGSGVAKTVNEVGAYVASRTVGWYFCILRDVLAGSDVIPNGGVYTVVYTLRTTV